MCAPHHLGVTTVVMAGTVKYLDLSDAFLSSIFAPPCGIPVVPFKLLLPAVLRYIAELQRCYSSSIYSLSTSVTASERCTCSSIGCSARHRNQVGALVIYLRPPVLLLSAAEAFQSLDTAPASVAVPADSTEVKDPVFSIS